MGGRHLLSREQVDSTMLMEKMERMERVDWEGREEWGQEMEMEMGQTMGEARRTGEREKEGREGLHGAGADEKKCGEGKERGEWGIGLGRMMECGWSACPWLGGADAGVFVCLFVCLFA